ncbi:MAG: alpha/beta fold hydrolase [Pseudolabrys sp.]
MRLCSPLSQNSSFSQILFRDRLFREHAVAAPSIPGLSEFGSKIRRRGILTTVANYGDWPALAQDAIQRYKNGRLRSVMIVGHSLGGGAAVAMAAELGRAGVLVQLVATLDPVGGSEVSSNVRRSVNIRPRDGEDHFSVIAAHDRDLSSYVLGEKRSRRARAAARHRTR